MARPNHLLTFSVFLAVMLCWTPYVRAETSDTLVVNPFVSVWREVYNGIWRANSLEGLIGQRLNTGEVAPAGYFSIWKSKKGYLTGGALVSGPSNPVDDNDWSRCDGGPALAVSVGKAVDLLVGRETIVSTAQVVGSRLVRTHDWFIGITLIKKTF